MLRRVGRLVDVDRDHVARPDRLQPVGDVERAAAAVGAGLDHQPGRELVDELHVDPHVGGALVGAHAAVPGVLPGALGHVVVEPVELVADHVTDERGRLVDRLAHRLPQPLEALRHCLGDAVGQRLGRVVGQVRLDQLRQRRLVVDVGLAVPDPLGQVPHRQRGGGVEGGRDLGRGLDAVGTALGQRGRTLGSDRIEAAYDGRAGTRDQLVLGSHGEVMALFADGYSGCGHSTDRVGAAPPGAAGRGPVSGRGATRRAGPTGRAGGAPGAGWAGRSPGCGGRRGRPHAGLRGSPRARL